MPVLPRPPKQWFQKSLRVHTFVEENQSLSAPKSPDHLRKYCLPLPSEAF